MELFSFNESFVASAYSVEQSRWELRNVDHLVACGKVYTPYGVRNATTAEVQSCMRDMGYKK